MRPLLSDWFAAHGLAPWLAPDYIIMGGIAGLLAAILVLRLARPEDRSAYARALGLAYVASYVFGTAFELIRSLPAALAGSGEISLGRAAWGGLLGSVATAWISIRASKRDPGVFFDRVSIGIGIIFGCVRIGCFLGGCDYGRPTSQPWGVHFPAGSFAATDHAALGWITQGDVSLAVHPTQLYEAAFGFFSAAVCALLLRRGLFERRLLFVWLALYSCFRFGNELLRGDLDRGVYAGLSTAQLTALIVLALIAALKLKHKPAHGV